MEKKTTFTAADLSTASSLAERIQIVGGSGGGPGRRGAEAERMAGASGGGTGRRGPRSKREG